MTRGLILVFCAVAAASVVDRVAVVVDKKIITESEVDDEVRITEFLNNQPLDLSAAERRAAAERLVDQTLIRNEMEISRYVPPSGAESDAMLRSFRQQRFPSEAAMQAALKRYGITEDDLKRDLAWQVTALRFTDLRFRSTLTPPTQSADRETDGAQSNSVDQKMDAWLKQARSNTKIVFKPEAFQ